MWMKIDDQLHAHRKTRALTKSHAAKTRDAAPMGLWVLAGSWAAQNGTDGWVPEDELDRWDDDWHTLVGRLVRTGWWWPQDRNAESGYGFNDWHDYNDPADLASKSGTYGNHVRWHVNESRVEPECEHCPTEPDHPDSPPDRPPISPPESGGDSRIPSPPIALPEPDPNPTRPEPDPSARATALAVPTSEPSSQTLLAEWIDHCAKKPPSRVIGHIAKEVKTMLDDGIEYERVRRGLAEWNARGLHASVLPSIVHEMANKRSGISRRQGETDELFERALARAQEGER